jgi:hypothetical protein
MNVEIKIGDETMRIEYGTAAADSYRIVGDDSDPCNELLAECGLPATEPHEYTWEQIMGMVGRRIAREFTRQRKALRD